MIYDFDILYVFILLFFFLLLLYYTRASRMFMMGFQLSYWISSKRKTEKKMFVQIIHMIYMIKYITHISKL